MKITFTKLPKEGEIKVSFDGGSTFTDYNVSDVSESGIQLDDSQDLREIKIKSRTTVLSNLEVITGIKVEQANNTSNKNPTYDLSVSTSYPACITNVTIPEGVKSIGDNVFYNCIRLTNITIPDSVTSISNSFYNCRSLTTINYTGTEEQWNAISKNYNWNFGCPSDMVINYNYQG